MKVSASRSPAKTLAFLGPSLPNVNQGDFPLITFANPIKRGDLYRNAEFETYLIIDGEFDQSLSISPKEILAAICAGKRVIGGSSMGALRASELSEFGMKGVGWVYNYFMGSAIRNDADVALLFLPKLNVALTVPHVNVEYWLFSMRHMLSPKQERAVRNISRRIFFADRTEERLMQQIKTCLGSQQFDCLFPQSSIRPRMPDIKAKDARLVLTEFQPLN